MNCKKVMVLFACIFVMMLQITPAVGSKQLVSRNKSSKKKDSSTDEMMMLNRIPLFQQPEYKHIWDIMIRYLDAPSYHNFTVLTPAIFKYIYYPIEEYTLWMYCQFKVKAEGFTSSTIMATLSNRPFGATMFRSPCSANLCAEAKTFMFESNTLTYGKYGEHEPIMGDYQQLDKQKKSGLVSYYRRNLRISVRLCRKQTRDMLKSSQAWWPLELLFLTHQTSLSPECHHRSRSIIFSSAYRSCYFQSLSGTSTSWVLL